MATAAPPPRGTRKSGRPRPRISPYDKIKAAILDGSLPGGEVLVETALAEWCGVSRTPVREALRRLEHDALVSWSERGLVVRERSPMEILDAYAVRILLEATAARYAAERRTEHDIMLMQHAADHCLTVDTTDTTVMTQANNAFHLSVSKAAHNEPLEDLLDRLKMNLVRGPQLTLAMPGRWDEGCQEHLDIVRAVADRDGDRAYLLTEEHFRKARDLRVKIVAADL